MYLKKQLFQFTASSLVVMGVLVVFSISSNLSTTELKSSSFEKVKELRQLALSK